MSGHKLRILGIDPGLQNMGWGVIEMVDNRLTYVDCGTVKTKAALPMSERLKTLDNTLADIVARFSPDTCALEETFVNKNPASALKLGMARGVAMVVPARMGLPVFDYPANVIKKTVVGAGHADKTQITMMVKMLLPKAEPDSEHAADALAIAICHAHHAPMQIFVANQQNEARGRA